MRAPIKKPHVDLTNQNGNAFAVMGAVSKALKAAGADEEYTAKYFNEAMSSDYDHLLQVTMEYVEVE